MYYCWGTSKLRGDFNWVMAWMWKVVISSSQIAKVNVNLWPVLDSYFCLTMSITPSQRWFNTSQISVRFLSCIYHCYFCFWSSYLAITIYQYLYEKLKVFSYVTNCSMETQSWLEIECICIIKYRAHVIWVNDYCKNTPGRTFGTISEMILLSSLFHQRTAVSVKSNYGQLSYHLTSYGFCII